MHLEWFLRYIGLLGKKEKNSFGHTEGWSDRQSDKVLPGAAHCSKKLKERSAKDEKGRTNDKFNSKEINSHC